MLALNSCESEDWSYYQGYCYWSSLYHSSVNDQTNNWFGAQIECLKKSANLVSIHTAKENQFIYNLSACATTWTGLALVNSNHKSSATGWQWIDTSARNFIHFYPGYPNAGLDSYGNCHAMHSSGTSHDGNGTTESIVTTTTFITFVRNKLLCILILQRYITVIE